MWTNPSTLFVFWGWLYERGGQSVCLVFYGSVCPYFFSVILSIGPYFVLYPLLSKIEKSPPEVLPLFLDSFRHTVRLTKHTGHVLVTTGVLLAWLGSWSWNTPWIIATLLILVGSLFFSGKGLFPGAAGVKQASHQRPELVAKLKRA